MVAVTEPDLEELTDELYVATPPEFVARRDHLAAQARAAGDGALAAAIKALRRPTVGAWYLNVASRAGLRSLRDLLALGDSLRTASEEGDFVVLRDLAKRRGPLVTEVVRELTSLLRAQGTAATPAGLDEVRATLAAALADPEVAEQVESGRLDRPHSYGGFGEVMVLPAGEPPARPRKRPLPGAGTDDAAARRDAEEAQERERIALAERELAGAEAELADATARRADAEVEVAELGERIASLTRQLAAAEHELRLAQAEVKDATADEKSASRRVDVARRAVRG